MNRSDRLVRNPDAQVRELDDEGALLYNPETDQIKAVNMTGLFIWERCNGEHDMSEISRDLISTFEQAPAEEVLADVEGFLVELFNGGFVGVVQR